MSVDKLDVFVKIDKQHCSISIDQSMIQSDFAIVNNLIYIYPLDWFIQLELVLRSATFMSVKKSSSTEFAGIEMLSDSINLLF